MTKANIINTIIENTAHAWLRLQEREYEVAKNLEQGCGYQYYQSIVTNDTTYNRLLGAWNELHCMCSELGLDYDEHEYNKRAGDVATALFKWVRKEG